MIDDRLEQFTGSRLSRRALLKYSAGALSAVSLSALLAACGDDDDDDDDDDTGTTPPAGATAPAAGTTPAGGTAPAGGTTPAGGGEGHVVEANDDLKFDPEEITIKVGETVTWMFVDTMPHSVTCDPSKAADEANVSLPDGAEAFDSGIQQTGFEFEHTFDVAGEYKYFCIPHESLGMVGTVIVEE